MSKSVQKGLLAVVVLVATTNAVFADAGTITAGFVTDVEPVFITAGIIMIGIGAIWSIKKVISLGNKS